MKVDKITLAIGILITLLIAGLSRYHLQRQSRPKTAADSNIISETLEAVDLRVNDFKYKLRSPRHSQAPIALITVDDDSLQEIERWPWSRELMAELTEKVIDSGARVFALDAIFSEAQVGGEAADQKFTDIVAAHKDKVILGTFSETGFSGLPYQDFCVTESFLRAGGEDIAKLNVTMIIEDMTAGSFDELRWKDLFDALFGSVHRETEKKVLQKLGRGSLDELKPFEARSLATQKKRDVVEFCGKWLTAEDDFIRAPVSEAVQQLYLEVVKGSPDFDGLNFEQVLDKIRSYNLRHPVPQYGIWTPNIPSLQAAADFTGSFVTQLDSDGYVRRYPMFFRSGNRIGSSYIPSLSLQSYLLATGYRADVKIERIPRTSSRRVSSFTIVDPSQEPERVVMQIPIDVAGQTLLNYNGPQNTYYYVPAKEFFSSRDEMEVTLNTFQGVGKERLIQTKTVNKKEFMKDRTTIFGATAIGVYDLRNVPLEANYPGPEIHMTMLANLFDQSFLRMWPGEALWLPLLILLVGFLFTYLMTHLGSMESFVAFLVLLGAAVTADILSFTWLNYKVSGFALVFLIVVIYFGITIYKYFTEEKKKRELKATFSKYVSPAVVDELLQNPDNLKLGGRRQRMTAFFSDVRGFTTISEKLTPEQLSDVLNLYLSPMTEIVFENKGTLDKYMGDAIMAFFGAPIAYDEHALAACRCALQNLKKLKEIQKQFEEQGLPMIDIGIGINTGPMSVGNMGSNIVQNYTIMGDAVNLASRLEGINKEYGTRIIISEFTHEDVKGKVTAREVDRVKVKGKTEPVRIFELIQEEPPEGALKQNLDLFTRGYETYMGKRFSEAKVLFQEALKHIPGDPVSELYVERCDEYIAEPPPADWDGVYVMKTK